MIPVTREMAREQGLKWFYTGAPCKHGHIAERKVNSGECRECARLGCIKRYQKDIDAARVASASRSKRSRKKIGIDLNSALKWSKTTPEGIAWTKNYRRKWEKTPHRKAYSLAKVAHRRALRLQACPAWVDKAAILAHYVEAKRLTRETGILHHVDHIVPLRGKNFCGLHVPWNLKPIPARENLVKGNRLLEHSK